MRRVFLLARRLAPTILFFEDLDLIGANRHGDGSRHILGELLTCLDGIESPDEVVVVATTNDLSAIEPALKDRPSRFASFMLVLACWYNSGGRCGILNVCQDRKPRA